MSKSLNLYRSLYRELSKQYVAAMTVHVNGDNQRNEAKAKYEAIQKKTSPKPVEKLPTPRTSHYDSSALREYFTTGTGDAEQIQHAEDMLLFLENQRGYKELLARYNPGVDMADQERVRLSARRVGLEVPTGKKDFED
ncbi:ATP synthase assembly factor FMC1 [Yarrowia sp. C11]|nr:ATP synthase assembly factor FMC1 [Yarrowia sp. E02]KAG5372097.1 ATP synthase assembly factor FMC1 [Yarrowia sp. C11]